jgi:hypothetical protein
MPVWLLAMEKDYCTTTHVVAGKFLKTMRQKKIDPHLVNIAVARLGLSRFHYLGTDPPPHKSVLLVSGSMDFLRRTREQWPNHQGLFLLDQPSRSKIKSDASIKWSRLRHQTFGGATSFVALLGTLNLVLQPQRTTLTRTVGHVLDQGIRPKTLPTGYQSEESMGVDDRVNPRVIEQLSVYRSAFSPTGWGLWQLTLDELGIAFGLPSWLWTDDLPALHFPFVPVQMMDGCLKALCATPTNVIHQLPISKPRRSQAGRNQTWLPELKCYLSHTWIDDDYVTAKAAKSDAAEVPTALWNQRILLPLPWATGVLRFLRTRLLARLQRRLYCEFHQYLKDFYGENWSAQLHQDQLRRRNVVLEDHERLLLRGAEGRKGGSRKGGRKQNRKRKKSRSSTQALTEDLVRDTEAGTDILYKICNSTWWNWTSGSTLIFWRWPKGEQQTAAPDGMKAWVHGHAHQSKTSLK